MQTDAFKHSVDRLFSRLGLPEPYFDASGSVRLRIEMVAVDLVDDDRGSMRIEGLAGVLPLDQRAKSEAMHAILRVNTGLMIDSRAGTYLKVREDGREMVCVEASHAYVPDDIDGLVSRIEDVVRRIEIHRAAFPAENSARNIPNVSSSPEANIENTFIFRA
ncbi:MAG: type III secretion system chaperone [Allorhizobium sp.]